MQNTQPDAITVPRLSDETLKAYASRLSYLTMGAGRSLEKVAACAQTAPEPRPSTRLATLKKWSARHEWQRQAELYDQALAQLAISSHAEQYKRDVEEHRARFHKVGKALFAVAVQMLSRLEQSADTLEWSPSDLAVIARAIMTAGDLEAHALQLGELLPMLTAAEA